MAARPPAEALVPVMLDQALHEQGRPKLSALARQHLMGEVRCPRRHLLAACIRTVHGVWVLGRWGLLDRAWRYAWLEEVANPAALHVWCSPCRRHGRSTHKLDLSDPTSPHLVR
jgi:hypothetical protein